MLGLNTMRVKRALTKRDYWVSPGNLCYSTNIKEVRIKKILKRLAAKGCVSYKEDKIWHDNTLFIIKLYRK